MAINPVRNFVYSFVRSVKSLCRFITRHQGTFMVVISSTVTNPADLAAIQTMITAIVAGCAALDKYYQNIPA